MLRATSQRRIGCTDPDIEVRYSFHKFRTSAPVQFDMVRAKRPRLAPSTNIPSSRDHCQGARNGRVNYRRDVEAVQQTYLYLESFYRKLFITFFTEVGDHVEQDEEIATIETDKVPFRAEGRAGIVDW